MAVTSKSAEGRTARGRKIRRLCALTLVPLTILGLAACTRGGKKSSNNGSGTVSFSDGLTSRAKVRTLTFLMPQDPGDPFWGTIAQGAKDAAKMFNIQLDLQTVNNDPNKYNDAIGTLVAKKPAGMAVVIDNPDRYTENVCAAQKAGIKVIAYNITQTTAVSKCTEAFVGQDFAKVGEVLGQRLLSEVKLNAGDTVFTPVEFPEQVYAVQRRAGVQKALDSAGVKTDGLGTGIEPSAALDKMTSYLVAHKNIKAIVPLGSVPFRNVVKAMKDAGIKVPVVGFDVAKEVIAGIKSGDIIAAADQQPYIQGFQTVAQLALALDFALSPASVNSGGAGLVDKTNVDAVSELAGKVR
jgi:simple sugar transport system substrate-binding protein